MSRIRWTLALLAPLAACGGPNQETLVDELRVLALVAEPPELAPLELTQVTPLVADPYRDHELVVWSCTTFGEGCLESAADPSTWGQVLAEGESATILAHPALTAVLGEDLEELPVSVWALACEPGICPIIEAFKFPPAAGSPEADALAAAMEAPFDALEEDRFQGVSLARGGIYVSNRPASERRSNPTLTLSGELPELVEPGETVALTFDVEGVGALDAYGFSSVGGFVETDYSADMGPGAAARRLFADTGDTAPPGGPGADTGGADTGGEAGAAEPGGEDTGGSEPGGEDTGGDTGGSEPGGEDTGGDTGAPGPGEDTGGASDDESRPEGWRAGSVELEWIAPEEIVYATLWVVLQSDGGAAVWSAQVRVEGELPTE